MNKTIWYLVNAILVVSGIAMYNIDLVTNLIGQEMNAGIAAGLIGTGICGVVTYIATSHSEQRFQGLANIQASGINNVFKSRSVTIREEYSSRIEKAHSIDIIGFGLSAFREDYSSKYMDMAREKKVRILIAHPEFPTQDVNYCDQRDVEEGNVRGQISADIMQFLRTTEEVRRRFPQTFQVKRMKVLPSINVFRMDKELLWGPYLVQDQSRNMPTFLVSSDGHLFETINKHFEAIWNNEMFSESV